MGKTSKKKIHVQISGEAYVRLLWVKSVDIQVWQKLDKNLWYGNKHS